MTQRGASDVLALGFGTAMAMWGLGYLGRLPGSTSPSWLIGAALLACLVAGGFVAGRTTGRGWAGGAQVGLLASALNLLVLGRLVATQETNRVAPSALWWLPGSLLLGALLGGLGAVIAPALYICRSRLSSRRMVVAISSTGLVVELILRMPSLHIRISACSTS